MIPLPYVEAACPIGNGQRDAAGILEADAILGKAMLG